MRGSWAPKNEKVNLTSQSRRRGIAPYFFGSQCPRALFPALCDVKTIYFIVICLILFLALFTRAEADDTWVKVSGGSWNPSPTMLTDLKAQIESYVKSQAKTQGRELKRWRDYTFQFQGREEKGGIIFLLMPSVHRLISKD